jgi:hypothetical protein
MDQPVARKSHAAEVAGPLRTGERVSIIGIVVSNLPGEVPAFVIDDRSALLLVRCFGRAKLPSVGSCVHVLGSVRDFEGERYCAAEIVKELSPQWLDVRTAELVNQTAFTTPVAEPDDADALLLRAIRELDRGDGAAIDALVAKAGASSEARLALMIAKGDVFEVSPGKVKILE